MDRITAVGARRDKLARYISVQFKKHALTMEPVFQKLERLPKARPGVMPIGLAWDCFAVMLEGERQSRLTPAGYRSAMADISKGARRLARQISARAEVGMRTLLELHSATEAGARLASDADRLGCSQGQVFNFYDVAPSMEELLLVLSRYADRERTKVRAVKQVNIPAVARNLFVLGLTERIQIIYGRPLYDVVAATAQVLFEIPTDVDQVRKLTAPIRKKLKQK